MGVAWNHITWALNATVHNMGVACYHIPWGTNQGKVYNVR